MVTGRGRPRDAHIDEAVLEAAAGLLDREGYGGLAIEEVARRAQVSKAAVYRRWPNRRHLALAVLGDRLGRVSAPDSGCTLCDLHECLVLVTEAFCRLGPGTLAQLIAEGAGDPAAHEQLEEVVLEPPRRAVHRTLFAALRRGDLRDDVDLPLAVDALTSLVFYRLLLGGEPMEPDQLEVVVTATLRGIASDGDALLREYSEHEQHEQHEPA
ncbi:transcriptional regulator, TetR family [Beutenbergia cavernae DSM 12333]|uniref:Transcriptional regulator, TetR family n=1 Tax=Beutenbergia cavernae (strain ATCC BAA-8 / DSM 12333 / CCUG 43141 / JCM 11478 / NBRC 16432 / NCIMB 13614 / HKI 0122) TaxID=471853 RepID=C5C1G6_BEUC1|nr:TetR/AcrR family transcriptional regulator [Beutenbergia cavernae]ACQ81576.1 transcriptional regulator, TetR family [Beutenbergia cavernae DSM 12333]